MRNKSIIVPLLWIGNILLLAFIGYLLYNFFYTPPTNDKLLSSLIPLKPDTRTSADPVNYAALATPNVITIYPAQQNDPGNGTDLSADAVQFMSMIEVIGKFPGNADPTKQIAIVKLLFEIEIDPPSADPNDPKTGAPIKIQNPTVVAVYKEPFSYQANIIEKLKGWLLVAVKEDHVIFEKGGKRVKMPVIDPSLPRQNKTGGTIHNAFAGEKVEGATISGSGSKLELSDKDIESMQQYLDEISNYVEINNGVIFNKVPPQLNDIIKEGDRLYTVDGKQINIKNINELENEMTKIKNTIKKTGQSSFSIQIADKYGAIKTYTVNLR
ncbi:MAG: hypothetical protein HY606_15055 [Planctomycetes bacterium]|nr:hypothetical protein [Planctomycetota bacterium]